MESKLKRPLQTNGSQLPVGSRLPGPSKLKPPGSVSKLPAPNVGGQKRARPNDEGPSAKRARVVPDEQENNRQASKTLRSSSSSGSLNSTARSIGTAPRGIKPSTSGSNLRNAAVSSTSTRTAKTTATVKPSVMKPAKPVGSRTASTSSTNGRPPAGGSTAPPAGGSKGKKRPAWDLKGRLEDMEREKQDKESQLTGFMSQMSEISARILSLEQTNNHLSDKVVHEEAQATHASRRNEELHRQLQDTEDELNKIRRNAEQAKSDFEFTRASLQRQKESLEAELTASAQEVAGLKVSVAELTSSQSQVRAELDSAKMSLEKSLAYGKVKDQEVAELLAAVADYKVKSQEWETQRRQLHNSIQELKGNIRVFCRVRPLLSSELVNNDGEMHHMMFPENDDKSIELQKLSEINLSESTMCGVKRDGKGRYAFSFDRVFAPGSTQSQVFEDISQLVQSALDGYNVCIFAYGQTGSGKTYTMEGPSVQDDDNRGMISRAVSQIFMSTRNLEEKSWKYDFESSFLEIYNESIRDLLGNHGNDVKHDIKLGANGKDVTVTNLTSLPVTNEDQILDMLKTASKNRAVGETLCNERSSRSHSVFRLIISGSNSITGETCKGTLNLVDLAGSERLKESGATGQRLKETQNINKSLSNLGNVIMALANKESHVPFRNSRLTYLLQNSLGGNSKTLMFVNVSPREENFSETLNSLRFATKVNQCNIGTATKKSR